MPGVYMDCANPSIARNIYVYVLVHVFVQCGCWCGACDAYTEFMHDTHMNHAQHITTMAK